MAQYQRGVDAILQEDVHALLDLLRSEDVVVRIGVRCWAPSSHETMDDFTRYADLDQDDALALRLRMDRGYPAKAPEHLRVRPEALPSLRRKLESYLKELPTPWLREERLRWAGDRGQLVKALVAEVNCGNNMYHDPIFGDSAEQAEISLLLLEIAREARGTRHYRIAAQQAALGTFGGEDCSRLRREAVTGPRTVDSPDEVWDRYLDWHGEILKYAYFHPIERLFYVDGEALEAGIPSAEYREEHPWGADEGPNVIHMPLTPAAQMFYDARMKAERTSGERPSIIREEAGRPGAEAGGRRDGSAAARNAISHGDNGTSHGGESLWLLLAGIVVPGLVVLAVGLYVFRRRRNSRATDGQ